MNNQFKNTISVTSSARHSYSFCFLTMLFVFIIIPLVIKSQTGPGGVGHRDSADMLVLWMKADEGITKDASDYVSLWEDVSGYDNDASSSDSDRPTYVDSAINNLPGISFYNDQMTITGDSSLQPEYITLFAVVVRDYTTGWGDIITRPYYNYNSWAYPYTSYTINANSSHFGSSTNKPFSQIAVDGTQVANWDPPHDEVPNEEPYIHALDYDGQGMGSYLNNGLTPGYSAYISHPGTLDYNSCLADISIGTRSSYLVSNPPGDHFLQGKISELIIYNTSLNEAAHIIVANALSAKYDIEIGYDFYNEQEEFTTDVIGIGRDNYNEEHLHAEGGNLILASSSFPSDSGYIFAGHNNNDLSRTTTNIPSTYNNRLDRIWYIDSTGSLPDSIYLKFILNYTPGGDTSEYGLLYSTNDSLYNSYEKMKATKIDQSNSIITFLMPPDSLDDGYYTLGSLVNHWLGESSNKWNCSDNWESGIIPGLSDNVTVPNDSTDFVYPVVSKGANAKTNNLVIESQASLTLSNDATLNASGKIILE